MEKERYGGAAQREAGRRRRILLRSIITAAFLACVLFIWHNSLESAEVSAGRSGRVTEMVNEVFASLGGEPVTEHFVRKLAHFSEYGLEGVLTVLLYLAYCFRPGKFLWRMMLTGLVTAVTDELLQFFSVGRAPGFWDVCIDMAGFICGVLLMCAACLLMERACKTWVRKRREQRSLRN